MNADDVLDHDSMAVVSDKGAWLMNICLDKILKQRSVHTDKIVDLA